MELLPGKVCRASRESAGRPAAPSAEPPVKPKHAWGRRVVGKLACSETVLARLCTASKAGPRCLEACTLWPALLHLRDLPPQPPMAASQQSLLRRGPSRARRPPHSVGVHEAAQLDATWPRYGSWKRLLKQLINKLLLPKQSEP